MFPVIPLSYQSMFLWDSVDYLSFIVNFIVLFYSPFHLNLSDHDWLAQNNSTLSFYKTGSARAAWMGTVANIGSNTHNVTYMMKRHLGSIGFDNTSDRLGGHRRSTIGNIYF